MDSAEAGIYLDRPENFVPKLVGCGCHIEFGNKLLLLKRSGGRWGAEKWSVPGGTVEEGESSLECMVREIQEEVGHSAPDEQVKTMWPLYFIPQEGNPFIFHLFYYQMDRPIEVELCCEHTDFKWVNVDEAHALPLVPGGKEVLDQYEKLKGTL